jgi:hypothetical protein
MHKRRKFYGKLVEKIDKISGALSPGYLTVMFLEGVVKKPVHVSRVQCFRKTSSSCTAKKFS